MGSAKQKRLLIADDERPLAHALELKFKKNGFDVTVVENGQQAISELDSGTYDMLLLDLIMPEKSGFDVLEHLKNKGSKMPVFVLSNLSQTDDEAKARALGATDFVIKSNTPLSMIVKRVSAVFAKK